MVFHEINFPLKLKYGSQFSFDTNVAILQKTSGAEQRVGRWNGEQRTYDAAQSVRTRADLNTVRNFWRARGGSLYPFRLEDPEEFTTAANGIAAPTALDHSIGTGGSSVVDFQLITRYTDSETSKIRNIEKPKAGTVKVAVATVVKTEGVHYTVNHTTGIVTFDAGSIPTTGQNITAGCEFYVPVRFGEVSASKLTYTHVDFDVASLNLPMIEVFGQAVIDDDCYRGGGSIQPVTADMAIVRATMGETIRLQATAARNIYLESPTAIQCGHRLTLWNDSAFSLTVKSLGATVATILTNVVAEAHVFKTSTSQAWKLV